MHVTARTKALTLLTVQNATIVLITRASRIGRPDELYTVSTAVFVTEVVKGLISCVLAAREFQNIAKKVDDVNGKNRKALRLAHCIKLTVINAFTVHRDDFSKFLAPAVLYAAQNNLIYVALSNLPVAVYQATYQLKILTTAIFSVILLKRRYSALKWLSLVLLTAGVCVVQTPASHTPEQTGQNQDRLTGFLALAAACVSSGLAGAYFESILKSGGSAKPSPARSSASLAMQNFQLAIVSLPFALIGILISQHDRSRILRLGFFHGYTPLTQFVVFYQAVGGLLIAAVVKAADSVAKGFATSTAIILSMAISTIIDGQVPSVQFLLGATLVVSATLLFAVVS